MSLLTPPMQLNNKRTNDSVVDNSIDIKPSIIVCFSFTVFCHSNWTCCQEGCHESVYHVGTRPWVSISYQCNVIYYTIRNYVTIVLKQKPTHRKYRTINSSRSPVSIHPSVHRTWLKYKYFSDKMFKQKINTSSHFLEKLVVWWLTWLCFLYW